MNEIKDEIFLKAVHTPEEGKALLDKLTQAASPQAVFGDPIQQGDTTVVTANAVSIGLGFGMFGFVLERNEGQQEEQHTARNEVNGGGGGGGGTIARPVAVVSINPKGVKVTPVIDVTKICLAFFTTFAAMFIAIKKIAK
jgi:uncharacterized spore protein YtfJ